MTLQPGVRLGPYEVTASIGAGGMGEVYAARDTRLQREVAIKVLSGHLADSPERRERFQREARAISSLNHPRICTLHDVGEQDGVPFLVLERLEGETLAERLRRGRIPSAEAMRLAAEIAEALDAAHRRGLIHRDLKPGNVMLTASGVKVLDFGLARALEEPAEARSQAPTSATPPATAEGVVLGTLQYMAPEQIEGRLADARTDLFALGAVLYEMLTGRKAFPGDTQGAIIASTLKEEPPPLDGSLPAAAAIERCLRRCLAKDPEERWQSARDLMHELRWLAAEPVEPAGASRAGRGRPRIALLVAPLALLAGLLLGWIATRGGEVEQTPLHLQVSLAPGTRLNGWASPIVALSPDGRALAYVADDDDGRSFLYVRRLDSSESLRVPDSETAEGPFFSPDGRWVGFAVGVSSRTGRAGELLKYSLETGLTQTICPLQDFFGAQWGPDGRILFVNLFTEGLWMVPESGGAPQPVLPRFRVDGEEVRRTVLWPVWRGGRHVVLTDESHSTPQLALADLQTGDLVPLGIQARRALLPSGRELFYVDAAGTLFRVPFDPDAGRPDGTAIALLDGISLSRGEAPVVDLSAEGSLVYSTGFLRGSRIVPSQLVRIDASGTETILPFDPQIIFRGVTASPSGDRLAMALRDGSIWILDVERVTRVRLPPTSFLPPWSITWSPDGRRIAYSGAAGERGWALIVQPTSGSEEGSVLVETESDELYGGSWTPDGRGLVYVRWAPTGSTIVLHAIDGSSEPVVLVDGARNIGSARLSPDGRWIAYDSPDTGEYEIYAQEVGGAAERPVLSSGGGSSPRWSADGRELYYYSSGRLMSVRAPSPSDGGFGRPREVLRTDIEPWFDVAPQGGFYGYRPVPGVGIQTSLQFVLNWRGGRG